MIWLSDISTAVTSEPGSGLIWGALLAGAGAVATGIASGFFGKIGEGIHEKVTERFKGKKPVDQLAPPVTERVIERIIEHPPVEEVVYPNVPTKQPYIDKFLGRGKELEDLSAMVRRGEQIMLTGVGGLGKSTLAGRLFQTLRAEEQSGFDFFCWVQCVNDLESSILGAFTAPEFEAQNQQEKREKVFRFLKDPRKKLLVLDNVERHMEDALLRELRDLPQIQVLLTTRCEHLLNFTVHEMEFLSEAECIELFYAYCPILERGEQLETVKKLVELVDRHTLALELLAKAVPRDRTLEEFHQELTELGFDLRGLREVYTSYDEQTTTIAKHLRILYDITKLEEVQRRVMRTLAFLPTMDLPPELGRWMKCGVAELEKLAAAGWLESRGRGFYLHPVVKETVLLDKGDFPKDTGAELVESLARHEVLDKAEGYDTILKKLDLMDGFMTNWRRWNPEETEQVADACHELGYHCSCRARFQDAVKWSKAAVEIRKEILPGSVSLATSYNNLGSAYGELGDHRKELEYLEKALEIWKKVLPSDHPNLAASYNNVGSAYGNLGDHRKELEYKEKALEIRKKVLPADHPDLAQSYNNVGLAYGKLGDHRKELEYQEKALEIWKKVLPANHPDLARSYNNVGSAYGDLGDHRKELEYQEKALEIWKKVLPADHPTLAASYNNVGYAYGELGDHQKELEYKELALEIRKKVLPADHPDLAGSYNNVGSAYGRLGDHYKELEYQEQALEIRKKVLPADHPNLATSYNNVGSTLYQLNRHQKAREMLLKAVHIWEARPECRGNLAGTYNWLSDVEEALGNATAAEEYRRKRQLLLNGN